MGPPAPDNVREQFARFDPGPILPALSPDGGDRMDLDEVPDILRIAIDFGTTFSSVAYARTPASGYTTTLMDIACISRYPGDRPAPTVTQGWEPRQDVPTELCYTAGLPGNGDSENTNGYAQEEERRERESSTESDASSAVSIAVFDREETPDTLSSWSKTDQEKSPDGLIWGFEVQNHFAGAHDEQDGDRHLARFKLLLGEQNDKSRKIEQVNMDTLGRCKRLKRLKLIKSNNDAITHFLEKLFCHVQAELQQAGRLEGAVTLEFVLCVPAEWPSKACRIMQHAMAEAAKRSGFGQLKDGHLDNLFIVSEPEAAAACIMAERENDIFPGETIVLLDAGGGTVDAVTYQVTNSDPLRMSAEVVPPKTELCGASYINEHYANFLHKKLKNETYLESNGMTIRSIIDQEVLKFENTTKRVWNLNAQHYTLDMIKIVNLQPSQTDSQLLQNYLRITREDVERIFRQSLKGTTAVLNDQLEMAKAKGYAVQKVLLTGGFGQSAFLKTHLERFLARQTNLNGGDIPLLVPKAASTAVARGAVLRASNKELGPVRKSQCSYGFLRSEPHEPKVWAAHKGTKPRVDPVDGEKYVHNTVDWLFQRGEELEVGKRRSIIVRHTFPTTRKHLKCEEVLYVSDEFKESHYRLSHAMNKGAEIAGSIPVDMTFLKTEGHIKPEPVSEDSAFFRKKKEVYVVEFELVVIVDGRNLLYEARWPVRRDGEDGGMGDVGFGVGGPREQEVCARGQTCIAAGFRPGTA